MPAKVREDGVKKNATVFSPEYHGLRIVVEDLLRHASKEPKGLFVFLDQGGQSFVGKSPDEHPAGVTQGHDEEPDPALGLSHPHQARSPIDLRLLSGTGLEPDRHLESRPMGPQRSKKMLEGVLGTRVSHFLQFPQNHSPIESYLRCPEPDPVLIGFQ